MAELTIFEFDRLVSAEAIADERSHVIQNKVFNWLESLCLGSETVKGVTWLKLTRHGCHRAIQVSQYVGVLQSPCGFQIEILPKTARHTSKEKARQQLIDMLVCLPEFRHLQAHRARLLAAQHPLLEVFISEFLQAVAQVVKRGLRSHYVPQQNQIHTLRGKLLMTPHLRSNSFRADRFYTEHDEFSANRPENRLLHTALRQLLRRVRLSAYQPLIRELCFAFAGSPQSDDIKNDLQNVRIDRNMGHYKEALDWAALLLQGLSPLTGTGQQSASSLLFAMDALFEAFITHHLPHQLAEGYQLKAQTRSQYMVEHCVGGNTCKWFNLRPDLLIRQDKTNLLVLDAKWKLLDMSDPGKRYALNQTDFYQLLSYGHHYLNSIGNLILIYPKTDLFTQALPVFTFPRYPHLRLWVVPFCLDTRQLLYSDDMKLTGLRKLTNVSAVQKIMAVPL